MDPDAKVIISSGYTDDPIVSGYARHGFQGAMTKPYRVDELKETLERVIGGNQDRA